MKVLVIPDVHLKPRMFERAWAIIKHENIDKAVCLMDIPDDWKCMWNLDLYRNTFYEAALFAQECPETLWCYGNHDVCYLWNQRESGYSPSASRTVCEGLEELKKTIPDKDQIAYIHRIDNILFMHGGLSENFALFAEGQLTDDFTEIPFSADLRLSTDELIRKINSFGYSEMWNNDSPIWLRPQYERCELYKKDTLLQIVGHTPVTEITQKSGQNLISCDTFSTDRERNPLGNQEFLIIDTETWEWHGIT